MKLGWSEWWLMNNPVRYLAQRLFEGPVLKRMGGAQTGALALEIGCGGGGGISLIYNLFHAGQVHAFDLDPAMMQRASRKNRHLMPSPRFWVGNVRHIPAQEGLYDAVFDFGALHHVKDWVSALTEVHRILKPGGRFYIEEISRNFITHPFWRRLLDHPQENRFDHRDLITALETTGFIIRSSKRLFGLYIWIVADKAR